jgi:hypothetical protein
VGEIYANGDGTDSWCRSNVPVLNQFYSGGSYIAPECNSESCLFVDFNEDYTPFTLIQPGAWCNPVQLTSAIFICEYP